MMTLCTLSHIPTMADFLPGYDTSDWLGLGAPKNTPVDIIEKLNMEINAGLANPKFSARLADLGGAPLPGSPGDFRMLITADIEKWAKVIRFSGIKAE